LELDIVQYDLDEATKNRLENAIKNFVSKSGSMLAVLCEMQDGYYPTIQGCLWKSISRSSLPV
jgi:hypothetical protein